MYLNVLKRNFKWTRNLVYLFFGCDSLGVCSYAFVFVYRSLMLLLCFLPLCPIILPMNSWIACGLLRCCCMNATEWIEEPAEQQERKKNGKIWLMNVVFLPVERNVIRSLFWIVIPFQYPHTHILHLNTGGGRKMENVLHLTEIPYIYEYLHMLQMQSSEFHLNFSHSGTVGIRFFFLFTRPFAYTIFFGTHKNGTKWNGMY